MTRSGDLSLIDQILQIIPTNPFAAAAEENILQVVVFTILFAVAASRHQPPRNVRRCSPSLRRSPKRCSSSFRGSAREPRSSVRSGVQRRAEIGLDAARALTTFAIITSVVMVVAILGLTLRRGPRARGNDAFVRAAWPGQVVALTRSSLASVPALLEERRTGSASPTA